MAETYGDTRDRYDGQTRLSTLLQNGLIDPRNVFLHFAEHFKKLGYDIHQPKGNHAKLLRQFAFREINILKSRKSNLTMEDDHITWAKEILHWKAFENLQHARPNPKSTLTFDKIKQANTGIKNIDIILKDFLKRGIMPNRARMYFASTIFYESTSGYAALELILKTFDLLCLDSQSPNNYMQCVTSYDLSYGKVMKFSGKRSMELLDYKEK